MMVGWLWLLEGKKMIKLLMEKAWFITLGLILICHDGIGANAHLVIAAENDYGEVAKEIGGPYVKVTSILNNPNQDPHLFTTNPSTAVAIAKADIIVYNGVDYDPWMQPLLVNHKKGYVIVVAELMGIKSGSNPHIWYLPETMPVYAKHLTGILSEMDPAHQLFFQNQLKKFSLSYQPILKKIQRLHEKFNQISVIATEPVFNDMAQAIGLKMHGEEFQLSIMNDVPPTFSQVKAFEDDIRNHLVKVFIYNNQVINPATKKMLSLAESENIPVVGVSETMPNDLTYVQWIMQELNQLEGALEKSKVRKHDPKK